jgi:hypothetical protein
MLGNLEPEESLFWDEDSLMDQVQSTIDTLGWAPNDDIVVEIGGTVVSGIHQGEGYNKKWAADFGVRKYNKDAFVIISNNSRRDLTKSQPMDREHKPHHSNNEETNDTADSSSNPESNSSDGGV